MTKFARCMKMKEINLHSARQVSYMLVGVEEYVGDFPKKWIILLCDGNSKENSIHFFQNSIKLPEDTFLKLESISRLFVTSNSHLRFLLLPQEGKAG